MDIPKTKTTISHVVIEGEKEIVLSLSGSQKSKKKSYLMESVASVLGAEHIGTHF